MEVFVQQMPTVLGRTWHHLCQLRGVKEKQQSEQNKNIVRKVSVFQQVLSIVRQSNRKQLLHWAFINSVTNFTRGVTRSVESAQSYYGYTVSVSTRTRMMARIMRNDPKGLADKNTLLDKQKRLLRPLVAVIFAYDNYQGSLSLQHQRGAHLTTCFKGTHQCYHKVIYFEDETFDGCYVDFTQDEQAIPSPWGMPVFEMIDLTAPSSFILNYITFQSTTTPDFIGKCVSSYIKLRDI